VSELSDFVTARLDAAEAYAREPTSWNEWDPGDPIDPDRQLRVVAFLRGELAGHTGTHRCAWGDHVTEESEMCAMQRKIAWIDRDHPRWQQGWEPS
jgi:hypothetical protein